MSAEDSRHRQGGSTSVSVHGDHLGVSTGVGNDTPDGQEEASIRDRWSRAGGLATIQGLGTYSVVHDV